MISRCFGSWEFSLFVLALLALSPGPLLAQSVGQPAEINGPAEILVAASQGAWCSALSPDETWIATCYGQYAGDIGRLNVWDLKTGQVKWQAREGRGIRVVAVSPDGLIVASGNFGGEIRLRNAASGEVLKSFGDSGTNFETLAFSADGRRFASGGYRGGRVIQIWDVASGQLQTTLDGHTAAVHSVAFSADDKLLVSSSRDSSLRIWDVEAGAAKQAIPHLGEVLSATFVGGGKQIATLCVDGRIRLFNSNSGENTAMSPQVAARLALSALAATADGKQLAIAVGTQIRIVDASKLEETAALDVPASIPFGLTWMKDGQTLISSESESSIRVWDVPLKKQKQMLSPPISEQLGAGMVRAMALDSSGKLLAVAADNMGLELRDAATGAVVRSILSRGTFPAVCFSPDGRTLAAANGDNAILFDVESGKAGSTLIGSASTVAWSPKGDILATAGRDKFVRLWDAATAKQIAALEGHIAEIVALTFSSTGKQLVSSSNDGTAKVWDVEKQSLVTTLKGHAALIKGVAITSDGKTIATASDDGTAKLWDAPGFKTRATLNHQGPIQSVALSPDGRVLATGGEQGGIRLWDVTRGTQRKILAEHGDAVTGLSFLPDGSGLISASRDRSIRLWKAEQAVAALVSMPAHRPEAIGAAFSPDGKWLVTCGADRMVTLTRDPLKQTVRRVLRGHTSRVYRAVVSPDNTLIASSSGDGTVRVWSIQSGEQTAIFNAWSDKLAAARAVAFSPDGRTIASGADDGTIKLWNAADQKEIQTLNPQELPVTCVAFSADGKLLVSSTGDWRKYQQRGALRLWDVASGKEVGSLEGHTTEIKTVAIDPLGKWIASGGADRTVRIWDLADRTTVGSLRLGSACSSLAFSTDGKRLAAGGNLGDVTICDAPSGSITTRLAGHAKAVTGIAFSPDGKLLATAGHDGVVSLWPADISAAK